MGDLKISSGGKLKISSGKLTVKAEVVPSITVTMEIQHMTDGAGTARYAFGLANTVTYNSGYLHRIERVESGSTDVTLNFSFDVPNAVASDGTVDFYIYTDVANSTGFSNAQYNPLNGDVEDQFPSSENGSPGRLPVKVSSNSPTVEIEIEWET